MTQFSSRPPFNDDPRQWICTSCSDRFVREQMSPTSHVTKRQPRPEFDRLQNNPTNPILTAVRGDVVSVYGSIAASAKAYLDHITERRTIRDANAGLGVWTPAHIDHARLVLTRLAAIRPSQEVAA